MHWPLLSRCFLHVCVSVLLNVLMCMYVYICCNVRVLPCSTVCMCVRRVTRSQPGLKNLHVNGNRHYLTISVAVDRRAAAVDHFAAGSRRPRTAVRGKLSTCLLLFRRVGTVER